jgi:hypothetical protein
MSFKAIEMGVIFHFKDKVTFFFISMHYFAHKMNFGHEHGHFVGNGFSALVGCPFVKLIYFLYA